MQKINFWEIFLCFFSGKSFRTQIVVCLWKRRKVCVCVFVLQVKWKRYRKWLSNWCSGCSYCLFMKSLGWNAEGWKREVQVCFHRSRLWFPVGWHTSLTFYTNLYTLDQHNNTHFGHYNTIHTTTKISQLFTKKKLFQNFIIFRPIEY